MKKTMLFGILVFSAAGAVALGDVHRASASDRCKPIHARLADSITFENCASPVGLCTAGAVHGGSLDGALQATVMNIVPGATPGTSSIDAFDVITTEHGTLSLHVSGLFDPVNGVVTFVGQSPSGTGRFEGVTGRVYINGAAAASGGFESDVSGELCFPEGADDDD